MNVATKDASIDSIIEQMDTIIQRCINEKSKLGYFAVLYKGVTTEVKAKIKIGYFDDNERMQKLVIVFAGRYLDAINRFWNKEHPSKSWLVAFETTQLNSPIILQHLMLGMNAHINLDLAIATAEVAPKESIANIKNDFNKIMNILSNMIDGVKIRLESVSPSIKIFDWVGGNSDEKIAGFTINKSRDLAWNTAEKLAFADKEQFIEKFKLHDEFVAILAKGISEPPGVLMDIGLFFIRLREEKNTSKVISALLQ